MTEEAPILLPFQVRVEPSTETTLLTLSATHGVPVNDLRRVNPNLADVGCSTPIDGGVVVHLPPLVYIRQPTFGDTFQIGPMMLHILAVEDSLRSLVAARQSPYGAEPFIPARRVASKTAALVDVLRRESATQLEAIRSQYPQIDPHATYGKSWKELLVEEVVDASPIVARMHEVEAQFHPASSGLHAHAPEVQGMLAQAPVRIPRNIVTEANEHTVLDDSAPPGEERNCPYQHSREIEVVFYRSGSAVMEHDSWAVLPCQSLASLVDALECANTLLPFPSTKNQFLFIAGTFYIDDRHADYEDLSTVIRTFDPSGSGLENGAYGRCAVKSINTLLADVDIKCHEMCVYRHLGSCDHYFYFKGFGPSLLRQRPRREYPRRTSMVPPKVTLCEMCGALPATMLTYGDRLAPKNPTLFCPPCYRIFHVDELGEATSDGFLTFELPPGRHF